MQSAIWTAISIPILRNTRGTYGDLTHRSAPGTDIKRYLRLPRTSHISRMLIRFARLYICGMVGTKLYYLYFFVHPFVQGSRVHIWKSGKFSLWIALNLRRIFWRYSGWPDSPPRLEVQSERFASHVRCINFRPVFKTISDEFRFSVKVLIRDSVVYFMAVNSACLI